MKTKTIVLLGFLFCIGYSCQKTSNLSGRQEAESGAAKTLDHWAFIRAYPQQQIPTKKWLTAFEKQQNSIQVRNNENPNWESLGPNNIGGRTLCLAFHPDDPGVIYAGSASGGLWKTTSAGVGTEAWERIPTGFPALAISSIAISPDDPNIIYLGTGEVYSSLQNTMPGIVDRLTRGTYGIGILKSVDGGLSWASVLPVDFNDLYGVQDLVLNPLNPNTIYAATTDGLWRSYDAGANWTNIHNKSLAVNILIQPSDTSTIFVTHGSFDPNLVFDTGVFRSEDGGNSFQELNDGLPSQFSGKAMLAGSPSDPEVIYASVHAFIVNFTSFSTPLGLYKTENGGDSWAKVSDRNVAAHQGWYSHDIAVKPDDANTIIYGGFEGFKSVNGGTSLFQKTFRLNRFMGQVAIGGPEGQPNYVHADIHRIYYHPTDFNTVFMATDGGIFVSDDNGETWEGRNGSYVTTQFYSNFSNSTTDSLLAIGGLQDNHSAVYRGDPAWFKILAGDGFSTAIHPLDDNIMYGSSQLLNVSRSMDKGFTFSGVFGSSNYGSESVAFSGPYEIAPSSPNILYAGAQRLYKTINGGSFWLATSPNAVDGDNVILKIAIGPDDSDLLYVSTAPSPFFGTQPPHILKSSDSGQTWTTMQGLPNRIFTDIAIHPNDPDIVYVTLSGFNTTHIYKTEDGGTNWFAVGDELPDVSVNTILIDPEVPEIVYVGNDLGVYASTDAGEHWESYSSELPDALMVMDLSISPSNRKLRVASHGNGVYQADLLNLSVASSEERPYFFRLDQNYPNPVNSETTISFELGEKVAYQLRLFSPNGQLMRLLDSGEKVAGRYKVQVDLQDLHSGVYFYQLIAEGEKEFKIAKTLIRL